MDDFIIDATGTGTGFRDFTFDFEGSWDDASMGIEEPTIGDPNDNYNPTNDAGLTHSFRIGNRKLKS